MLDGVIPFPADFAARYRAAGYWQDRPLIDGFRDVFQRFATRIAVVDGTDEITYGQVDERSTRLARALLDLGIRPLDRIVVQLPNVAGFVYLYFALQKVGAIPILALPGHRRREIDQFAGISDAIALAIPAQARGFDYITMAKTIMADHPGLRLCLVQGADQERLPDGFISIEELLAAEPSADEDALAAVDIDPADPAVFPAVRRYHRDTQAHPAQPQRLPVQLQARRLGLRHR